jgi:hypothetical protein
MKNRCFSPTNDSYYLYGGRGITVCDRWLSFQNFYDDMSPRPQGKEIDRINNDGPYSPDNCRWATKKENNRNKRTTRFLEFNGEVRPLIDWAEAFGLRRHVVIARLDKGGWTPERALTTPVKTTNHANNHNWGE